MLPPRLVLQDVKEFPFSFQKWLLDVQAYLVASGASGVIPVSSGGTGQTSYTDGQLLIGNTTGNTLTKATLTAGTGISVVNGSGSITISATNLGTVTSVAQSFTGGLISVSGSPITSSGTLALTVAGTSGGIPYFSGATTWASSGELASQAIVLGGGAGASPTGLALGSAHQVVEVNTGATAPQYTSWPTMRRTIAVGQTLTVNTDYSACFVGYLINNGTVTNNGAIAVI